MCVHGNRTKNYLGIPGHTEIKDNMKEVNLHKEVGVGVGVVVEEVCSSVH